MLGQIFPHGTLTHTLANVGDDALAWAMQYANSAELARIAEEMDRRDAIALPAPAETGNAVTDLLDDRNAIAEAMGDTPDPSTWGALANDEAFAAELAAEIAQQSERQAAIAAGEVPQVTRAEARRMYEEYVYRQMLKAEDDLNGYLLTPEARAKGKDVASLFSGPARIAYPNASEELKAWWAENGRLTQAEFIEQATGKAQRWAAGARKNESDRQNRR